MATHTYKTTVGAGSVPVTCVFEVDHYGLELNEVLMDGLSVGGLLTEQQWTDLEMEIEHMWTEGATA